MQSEKKWSQFDESESVQLESQDWNLDLRVIWDSL